MCAVKFERVFGSEIYKVKPILIEAMEFLHNHIDFITVEDEYDMRLVFSELLFNAIIHGNKMDRLKKVQFSIEIAGDTINAMICDEGSGFDHIGLVKSFQKEGGLLNENGRGIRLAFSLSDSVTFNMPGNEIRFYKKLKKVVTGG